MLLDACHRGFEGRVGEDRRACFRRYLPLLIRPDLQRSREAGRCNHADLRTHCFGVPGELAREHLLLDALQLLQRIPDEIDEDVLPIDRLSLLDSAYAGEKKEQAARALLTKHPPAVWCRHPNRLPVRCHYYLDVSNLIATYGL